VSRKKPTLEDLVRMVVKIRTEFAKEFIGLRVTIESFPIDPPPKKATPAKVKS
jgi:hypothetical protein